MKNYKKILDKQIVKGLGISALIILFGYIISLFSTTEDTEHYLIIYKPAGRDIGQITLTFGDGVGVPLVISLPESQIEQTVKLTYKPVGAIMPDGTVSDLKKCYPFTDRTTSYVAHYLPGFNPSKTKLPNSGTSDKYYSTLIIQEDSNK